MLSEKELIDGQRWLACWEKVTSKPMTSRETFFARAIKSAACAERDARITELERELAEARKDAERLNFIEKNPILRLRMYKKHWSCIGITNYEYQVFKTVREAIDAAMKGTQ